MPRALGNVVSRGCQCCWRSPSPRTLVLRRTVRNLVGRVRRRRTEDTILESIRALFDPCTRRRPNTAVQYRQDGLVG
jgi:hypothetical protein